MVCILFNIMYFVADKFQGFDTKVLEVGRSFSFTVTYIYIYIFDIYVYVTCSNEMSRMSANLISRKHRINMQR